MLGNLRRLCELLLQLCERLQGLFLFIRLTLGVCVYFLRDRDKVFGIEIEVLVQRAVGVLVFEGLAPASVDLDLGHTSSS